jgi:hypothetical protein
MVALFVFAVLYSFSVESSWEEMHATATAQLNREKQKEDPHFY